MAGAPTGKRPPTKRRIELVRSWVMGWHDGGIYSLLPHRIECDVARLHPVDRAALDIVLAEMARASGTDPQTVLALLVKKPAGAA
jgi:hypothetical protein